MNAKRLPLVFVCKTHKKDFKPFTRLFKSFNKYNTDKIPLYLSVPNEDVSLFEGHVGGGATVISDESYMQKYSADDAYWGLPLGYVNQEICKLSFWENNIADNYLFIDSDLYFIRDFRIKDFMATKDTPYSVLVMDKDLNTEKFYREYGVGRTEHIKRIFDEVGLNDARLLTCHGMTVMNAKVLRSLKDDFMKVREYEYKDLIKISPFEYSWYNAWLQKQKVIEIIAVEPFFKTFHMRIEYTFSRLKLISESDLATQYAGIVLNSNWQPKEPPARYELPGKLHRIVYKILERVG